METSKIAKVDKRYVLLIIILVTALYAVLPQLSNFKSSWRVLAHPNPGWLTAAVVFSFLTYISAVMTYIYLAFRQILFARTLLMQLAAMFINRLFPAGIGAVGANFAYLMRNKHSTAQATTVVTVNNILGSVGHNILLLITISTGGYHVLSRSPNSNTAKIYLLMLALTAVLISALYKFGNTKIRNTITDLKSQLLDYRKRPSDMLRALLSSITLTAFNILCLQACALAIGLHFSFGIMLLIFTVGIGAGTITPTPGGLGGFEAGLVAGFVSYHVNSSTALAVALLFRLVSYWLPLLVGGVAFVYAHKQRYI